MRFLRLAAVALAALAVTAAPPASADDPAVEPFMPIVVRSYARMAARLRSDLEARGVSYADGTEIPKGGIGYDGRLGRRRLRVVPLAIPPEGSADMYTDLAFVDLRHHRYWARRTGGFLAVTQWVGPYRLPRLGRQ